MESPLSYGFRPLGAQANATDYADVTLRACVVTLPYELAAPRH